MRAIRISGVASWSRTQRAPQPSDRRGIGDVRSRNPLTIYRQHRHALVDYADGIVGSRACAEDIVQEAWLRIEVADKRRAIDEPLSYLYRVVRNLAIDTRRRLRLEGQRLGPPVTPDAFEALALDQPSPEQAAVMRDQLAVVMAALAELPARTRVAVEMHRIEGFKLREIAAHLDMSIARVQELVIDGVEHVRRRLDR